MAPSQALAESPAPNLTREQAIARALASSPEMNASAAGLAAAEAGLRQAGRRANPSVDLMNENFAGSGPYRSFDRSETSLSFAQPLEFGGDRAARRHLAEHDVEAARLGADIRRLDVIRDVEKAFVDAQAAEAVANVAQERLTVAREVAAQVDRRVKAARDPLMAESRAQAQLASAEAEAESARQYALAAQRRLSSYWGGGDIGRLDLVSFQVLGEAPAAGGEAPEIALAHIDEARAEARVEIERARARPDPVLQAGARRFGERGDTALMLGFSVPFNIWDRRSGAVAQARSERQRSAFERESRERDINRQRDMLVAHLDIARAEIDALDRGVLPKSEEALARARQGYAMGGFSYLDVLDAQRILAEARLRRINALRTYHHTESDLARLTGARASTPIEEKSE
jgi:cobalt-zinc-cadmium efflux system outer membrane protein